MRHLVPHAELLALTDGAEFRITPSNVDVLTPNSVDARPHTQIGCSYVRPLVIGDVVLFVGERDQRVHELGFSGADERFVAPDVALRAQQLFDGGKTILDAAWMRAPHPIAWFPSSSGDLLGFTYVPLEKVGAWHHHPTQGSWESVCCIPEEGEDRLYATVRRTINGQTRRFVERLGSLKEAAAIADVFYVDCGLTLTTSAAVTQILNLDHLENMTVQVLANGVVQPSRVVAGGRITLKTPLAAGNNKVHVGLGSTAIAKPVPPAVQVDGFGTARRKNVAAVWARMLNTASFAVGPAADKLRTDTATALRTAVVKVNTKGEWSADGDVILHQGDPLPLGCAGLTIDLVLGG